MPIAIKSQSWEWISLKTLLVVLYLLKKKKKKEKRYWPNGFISEFSIKEKKSYVKQDGIWKSIVNYFRRKDFDLKLAIYYSWSPATSASICTAYFRIMNRTRWLSPLHSITASVDCTYSKPIFKIFINTVKIKIN